MHNLVLLFGYASFIKILYKYTHGILTWILCTLFPIDLKKHGSWAIVTGATDGIGKAYCNELAKRGLNICLISRNDKKLEKIAAEIESVHQVKTTWIQFDFSKDDYADMKVKLDEQDFMTKKSIAVLINNVGTSNFVSTFEDFITVDESSELVSKINNLEETTRLNNFSPIGMTSLILPTFLEKNSGIIVNLSSIASTYPMPFIGVYSATKVFNYYFSDSLRKEMKICNKNIIVQTIKPGFVRTPLANPFLKPVEAGQEYYGSWEAPSAQRFVKNAVNSIGWKNDTNGIWAHSICYEFCRLLDENLLERASLWISEMANKNNMKNQSKCM